MAFAPVALFLYRRPEHTRRTLQALRACSELAASPLVIYCDAAKTPDAEAGVRAVRRIAHELAPASATFVERAQNFGLARSIITGATELCREHGRVIVVEDDLEVAPSFLRFMNVALDRYERDERVMGVSGYQFPLEPPLGDEARFLSFPSSWGWATWQRAWEHFDADARGYRALQRDRALRRRFDLDDSYPYFAMLKRQQRGEIDSWAIRWHLSVFMEHGLVLYPGRSLVRNTGFDGSGTHGRVGFATDAVANQTELPPQLPAPVLDEDAQARVFSYLTDQTQRDRKQRVKHVAQRLANVALSNRFVPAQVRSLGGRLLARAGISASSGKQDLDVYWDPKMAALLETWGTDNAWNEIQLLLANLRGKVIDIACGTGKVMTLLDAYPALEVHGFDISDFLIQKALDRGIPRERLAIADATKTDYADNAFDYGYSIGSLEHFTEDGVIKFAAETHRITRYASFHQMPTSRSGRDEGWMKTLQSFHNNSVGWWVDRFRSAYQTVYVLESSWQDKISVGKWFLCIKEQR
jgi:ubiquinone/menaquinone biosynthesis C-methylase UbiE